MSEYITELSVMDPDGGAFETIAYCTDSTTAIHLACEYLKMECGQDFTDPSGDEDWRDEFSQINDVVVNGYRFLKSSCPLDELF